VNTRETAKRILWTDIVLAVLFVLVLTTGLLDVRKSGEIPPVEQEWQDIVRDLDSLDASSVQMSIVNKEAFRTMRARDRVRKAAGEIGDYVLTGQGGGKAYFVHEKTDSLVIRSVGEKLEGYTVRKIGEREVELEKDEKIVELRF